MKIKRFFESSFFKVFNIIRNNHHTYLYTIVLDFIFLAVMVFLGKYLGSLIPQDPQQLIDIFRSQANLLIFIVGYPLVYYLFVIFVYSIAKLTILNLIKRLFEKRKFTLEGLGRFYLLNLLLFITFLLTALIIFGILALILRKDFLDYSVLVLAIPLFFFVYSIVNIAHTLFIQSKRDRIIKQSFKISFSRIKGYGSFVIFDIVIILLYLILFNIVHLIFRFTIFQNIQLLASYGPLYLKIFNIVSIIVIYLIVALNRIYFLEKKNVLQ